MRPFAEIMQELTDKSGMLPPEIAKRADLSLTMVRKVLNGERPNPGRKTIAGLAKAFQVKPQVFFD